MSLTRRLVLKILAALPMLLSSPRSIGRRAPGVEVEIADFGVFDGPGIADQLKPGLPLRVERVGHRWSVTYGEYELGHLYRRPAGAPFEPGYAIAVSRLQRDEFNRCRLFASIHG